MSCALVVATTGSALRTPPGGDASTLDAATVVELGAFLSFVVLGVLLVVRRPGQPIGPLMAALGCSVLLQQATQRYAVWGAMGDAPGWELASWIAAWAVTPPLTLLVVLLLLFPSGRPQSPSWRAVTWAVGVGGSVVTVADAVATWPVRGAPLLGAEVAQPAPLDAGVRLLAACLPLAVLSLVLRYRGADPTTRRQLLWLLLAAVAAVAATAVSVAVTVVRGPTPLTDALGGLCAAAVAAAIAVAILRHRLYEIDRILSRTVSWLLLSVALAVIYGAGVMVVSTVIDPVAADSSIAVAASTLAVAGVFNPLRARTQRLVDRRFNHGHHDRVVLVAGFGARLRDDVHLDALVPDVAATAARLVEPTAASVWLRSAAAGAHPRPPASRPPERTLS